MIIFENIGATLGNLSDILLATVCILLAITLLQIIGMKFKVLDTVKNMFMFNYIIKMIFDNALRLLTFSLVNLSAVRKKICDN